MYFHKIFWNFYWSMLFLYKVCTLDLLLRGSSNCHWSTMCYMFQARSGLCIVVYYLLLYAHAGTRQWWAMRSILYAGCWVPAQFPIFVLLFTRYACVSTDLDPSSKTLADLDDPNKRGFGSLHLLCMRSPREWWSRMLGAKSGDTYVRIWIRIPKES